MGLWGRNILDSLRMGAKNSGRVLKKGQTFRTLCKGPKNFRLDLFYRITEIQGFLVFFKGLGVFSNLRSKVWAKNSGRVAKGVGQTISDVSLGGLKFLDLQ